ncbi:MAG: hypothetical protein R2851_10565 [Caldilineaceae bacterium]
MQNLPPYRRAVIEEECCVAGVASSAGDALWAWWIWTTWPQWRRAVPPRTATPALSTSWPGGDVVTQREIAHRLGDLLDRPVAVEEIPRSRWEADAHAADLDAYAVDTLLRMFDYYARYGFYGNPTVLAMLLGRAPTSLDDFLRRHFG